MKTVLIDCSPKKRLSASGFLAWFTGLFIKGERVREKLRTKRDHERILNTIKDAETVVFAMPLYVDGVPSHVLPFLKEMETHEGEKDNNHRVYVLANNGFIEGRQNEPLMQVMENFCLRSSNTWCGGLGIGGGVMMNVMRILIMVYFAIMVLGLSYSLRYEHRFAGGYIVHFLKELLEVAVLGCGIISFDIWFAKCINRKEEFGKHYTRLMLPSFVFIIFTDIFMAVISVINGGIFKGWLSKKAPGRAEAKRKEEDVGEIEKCVS